MVARGVGRLMFTSSVAATMPGSFQSVYNASKSFVQSFAQALQEEVAGTGVTVTSFMPGPTETDFFRRAGMVDTKVGTMPKDDPAQVARQAFDAVMKGRGKLVTGSAKTKAQGWRPRCCPTASRPPYTAGQPSREQHGAGAARGCPAGGASPEGPLVGGSLPVERCRGTGSPHRRDRPS